MFGNRTGFVPDVLAASELVVFDQALSLGLLAIGLWWLWRSPVSFVAVWGGLLLWWEAESIGGHNPAPWLLLGLLLAVRKAGAIGRWFRLTGRGRGWSR